MTISLFAEEETFITARMEDVRGALGEGIFVAAWESGRTLPLDVAMKEALGFVEAALPLARAARVPAMDGSPAASRTSYASWLTDDRTGRSPTLSSSPVAAPPSMSPPS